MRPNQYIERKRASISRISPSRHNFRRVRAGINHRQGLTSYRQYANAIPLPVPAAER